MICSVIGLLKIKQSVFELEHLTLLLGIMIGLLFIIGFNVFALSIQESGLGITSLVQKLSVIATVLAAMLLGESISFVKLFGLILSMAALYLLFIQKKDSNEEMIKFTTLLFFSFLIASCIEIAFLFYNKNKFISHNSTQFTNLVFMSSTCFGLLYYVVKSRNPITKNELLWGLILGIPNYFSIEFLNKALENGMNGSQFFPLLNISVILLSGLFGFVIFKENFSNRQIFGYILALISILILAFCK